MLTKESKYLEWVKTTNQKTDCPSKVEISYRTIGKETTWISLNDPKIDLNKNSKAIQDLISGITLNGASVSMTDPSDYQIWFDDAKFA